MRGVWLATGFPAYPMINQPPGANNHTKAHRRIIPYDLLFIIAFQWMGAKQAGAICE